MKFRNVSERLITRDPTLLEYIIAYYLVPIWSVKHTKMTLCEGESCASSVWSEFTGLYLTLLGSKLLEG